MFKAIIANFGHYNLHELFALLQTPAFYSVVLVLIVLEITLSADNAVVLALLVKHLPPDQQKKALTYGIFGAYVFRVIAIGLGTLLIKLWWIKLIGGGYLLYLALKYFYEMYFGKDDDHDGTPDGLQKGLIGTIITIEAMDICFSMDSVLAAFGVSNSVWVLLIGGMMGILAMRFVATKIVFLLEKVPELETAAFVMITFIGGKMILSTTGNELHDWTTFVCMVVSFGGAFVINYLKKSKEEVITI